MQRGWNWERDLDGGGIRYADALGCISSSNFMFSAVQVLRAVLSGIPIFVVAERIKVDAAGNEIEPHRDTVGDFITIGYSFTAGEGEDAQAWICARQPANEGEQEARDQAAAIAVNADRGTCESLVQIKVALDRFGGQAFIKPIVVEEAVVGFAVQYDHVATGQPREPNTTIDDLEPLIESEGDEEPEEAPSEVEAAA